MENFLISKSQWGDGPWQSEPDRKEWKAEGFDCLIVRNRAGALCGYVGLPETHPFFGLHYDSERLRPIEVHGGLTYSGGCQGHICHESDQEVHWLGFDCAHAFDLMPAMEAFCRSDEVLCRLPKLPVTMRDTYRDMDYVTAEVENLARQLRDMAESP